MPVTPGSALIETSTRPRLGFIGVGHIGLHRLKALRDAKAASIAAILDPNPAQIERARQEAPEAAPAQDYDALRKHELDGIVIATPNALHAGQALWAIEAGLPVFCQKPLGRTADETRRIVKAAQKANRLLAIDFSYRHLQGVREIRNLLQSGELGQVYAANLVFHNAYGPDKEWFYDPARSGGGCVLDLGVHLIDLLHWLFPGSRLGHLHSRLFSHGVPLSPKVPAVEDYAQVSMDLDNGVLASLACSWNLPAGCDCLIEVCLYGTRGGVRLANCSGSFYDFITERFDGTRRSTLCAPPEDWGKGAVVEWAGALAEKKAYDPAVAQVISVAETIDAIYAPFRTC